ncbi:MAG: PKD domain-containing protein, partial [Candidatus Bipolaricaulia bacterium]
MRRSVNDPGARNIHRKGISAVEKGENANYNGSSMRGLRRIFGYPVAGLLTGILFLGGCFSPAENLPPVADFEASPQEGYAPLAVTLDASASYDPDGDTLSYEWILGDAGTATGRTVSHSFGQGSHTVTLRVTDARGSIDEVTRTVTARAVPAGFVVRRYEWIHEGETQQWDA